MGFVCTKAELYKILKSMRGIDRASHTKKNGVKDDLFRLQALAKNLMLFSKGLQLVSRPCVFTVLNLNKVCLPFTDIVKLQWV